MPLSLAQKAALENIVSELDLQVATLVVDPGINPLQAELDAAIAARQTAEAARDSALAQLTLMQQKIDDAKAALRAAAEADALEDAGRAGALAALEA
jgi:hypothetical protein